MRKLEAHELYRASNPDALGFTTTEDLPQLAGSPESTLGQPRALASLRFGVGVGSDGFNIYALGPPGVGKHDVVRRFLEDQAASRPVPADICYVYNFKELHRPRLLRLPHGRGAELRQDMDELVRELSSALEGAFESDNYHSRRQVLEDEFQERQGQIFDEIREKAREQGLAMVRTPMGVVFAPVREGEVLSPDEFGKLPAEERKGVEEKVGELQSELQRSLRQVPRWQRQAREKVRQLNREVIQFAVDPHLVDLKSKYAELEDVVAYLEAVEEDVVNHAREILDQDKEGGELGGAEPRSLRRYAVNLLVDHGADQAAPVYYEDNPTHQNLIGRIEHLPQMGTLVTDFTLIKPGALHRADGGYLIIEAERLLRQAFSYEAMKRALQSGRLKVETLGQMLSLISTVSLEPEPMPLDVKVVLVGSRMLYYLLCAYDPDFPRLFKVAADFAERMDRNEENERLYARLVGQMAKREGLKPLDAAAVARILDWCAREMGDAAKLSAAVDRVKDLLREASYWAGEADRELVVREDVEKAIEARVFRSDRIREWIQEEIARGTLLIDTSGERVGQINGLAVLQVGEFAFGRPNRITARVRIGKGELIDIEREVKLSGPFHSKGVLILSSFLAARYASDRPLSLAASLVFEQSYGDIDGDSASSTELYALLSAISGVPIRQSIAVTGSVNQYGEVQAIGGVNEKIEGFFQICDQRGLDGGQGVMIPASNVQHLMLSREVVEAVEAGRFHVWAVAHVDEGIEILTGRPAGERLPDGAYPEGSINALVEGRLSELMEAMRRFSQPAGKDDEKEGGKKSEETPPPAEKDRGDVPEPPQPPPPPRAPEPGEPEGKRSRP